MWNFINFAIPLIFHLLRQKSFSLKLSQTIANNGYWAFENNINIKLMNFKVAKTRAYYTWFLYFFGFFLGFEFDKRFTVNLTDK